MNDRQALRELLFAAKRVPIVRRPPADNGPPFSVCLGCGAEDEQPCHSITCWVSRLEAAIGDAEEALND